MVSAENIDTCGADGTGNPGVLSALCHSLSSYSHTCTTCTTYKQIYAGDILGLAKAGLCICCLQFLMPMEQFAYARSQPQALSALPLSTTEPAALMSDTFWRPYLPNANLLAPKVFVLHITCKISICASTKALCRSKSTGSVARETARHER